MTEYELSHHVLVVLAVRNKMLTKFFSYKFSNLIFAVKKNFGLVLGFFFPYGHLSQFLFSSKIFFSGFVEIKRNKKFRGTPEGYTC